MAQVESVIKSGVNVNEKDEESALGYAPLHYSAGAGKLPFSFIYYYSQ